MKKAVSCLLFLLLCAAACNSDKSLEPLRYMHFMEDVSNGARKVVNAGPISYTIQLATPEYLCCREFSEQIRGFDVAAFKSRLGELNGTVFFLINIAKKVNDNGTVQSVQEISSAEQMVMYYQMQAASDIRLQEDSVSHAATVFHFEDNYGLAPYNTIVAGFKVRDIHSDMKLVFNDRFYDNPLIQVTYSKETMSGLPRLDIK